MSNLIEIKNLFKEYNEILALNNVTLSIPKVCSVLTGAVRLLL